MNLTEAKPQAELTERVLEYPMDAVLQKYIDKYCVTEQVAREHERELKRYLSMCIINPSARYGMKGVVDELWHTFILFTREYAAFCEDVAGYFIHHQPTTPEQRRGTAAGNLPDMYARMLEDYPTFFGEEPPAVIWPRVGSLGEQVDCGDGGQCGQSSCSQAPGSCSGGNCGPSCGPNQPATCSGYG